MVKRDFMSQYTTLSTETGNGGVHQKPDRSWRRNARKIFAGMGIILVFYVVLKKLFHIDILPFLKDLSMLKYFPKLGKDASLSLLFVLGILTSFHCIGMCGGIAVSQTIRNEASNETSKPHAWIVPSVLYNSGRVIAYTLVGGIVGGLGQVVSFSGIWKGVVPILGGVFMMIMGVNLLGIFPALRRLNLRMPYFAAKKIQGQNNYGPFFIGLLSGLMPCGPLQIVQLYALGTGSVIYGALAMFIFALGTVPVMFSFGALNSIINKKQAGKILKISAIFVIILGLVMIGRGLALSGVPFRMPENVVPVDSGIARIDGNIQTVVTSIQSGSYPPIVVQKGIPVKWIIKVDANNLNGCNNAITIPQYKIDKKLAEGENVVEFTPRKEGDIAYTCWMGMIKSKIIVVADITKLKLSKFPVNLGGFISKLLGRCGNHPDSDLARL
jgi:sulfite exporter TauE/SafE